MRDQLTSESLLTLFQEQQKDWDLMKDNYNALDLVKVKDFFFDKTVVKVQFNPARINSTSAKVDADSIEKRACFLCPDNLPERQKGLRYGDHYQILVNPFPIFPKHFTIPALLHQPQRILSHFSDMLKLGKTFDKFIFFYNGPECGASAPDHMHFQAGIKGFLPIEGEWRENCRMIWDNGKANLYKLEHYYRNGILIESGYEKEVSSVFNNVYSNLPKNVGVDEPLLNLLLWYEDNKWIVCIFPREKHRPDCYIAKGKDNILISPASVDMGGVLIISLEKDFDKITVDDICSIFKEVSLSDVKMKDLEECLNARL